MAKSLLVAAAAALAGFCVNAATFTPGNLIALRMGPNDMNGITENGQEPVFLDEISLNPNTYGVIVQTIALPHNYSYAQTLDPYGNSVTVQSSQSQGGLLRSEDGRFISFTGWASDESVQQNGGACGGVTVLCQPSGACNTRTYSNHTSTGGLGGNNMRYSATSDGIHFWACGTNGLEYQTMPGFGGCSVNSNCNTMIRSPTVPTANVDNFRALRLYKNQLFVSSQSGKPICGVATYGTAPTAPVSTEPTTVWLDTNAGCGMHGFTFRQRDSTGNNFDLLAADRASGLYVASSSTGLTGTYTAGSPIVTPMSGVFAQHVEYDACTDTAYFTGSESGGTTIWAVQFSGSTASSPVLVATAPSTQALWHGVAMAPVAAQPAPPAYHGGTGYCPGTPAPAPASSSPRPSTTPAGSNGAASAGVAAVVGFAIAAVSAAMVRAQ